MNIMGRITGPSRFRLPCAYMEISILKGDGFAGSGRAIVRYCYSGRGFQEVQGFM